jgi:plasmid stabilization system protein ParE
MIQNLEWAPKAQKDYNDNIDYLLLQFPVQVSIDFIQKVEQTIDLIKQENITFLSTEYRGINKVVILPQITLYYRIQKETNTLQLVRFWNNKKDPKSFSI